MVMEVLHAPGSTNEEIEIKNKAVLKADLFKRLNREKTTEPIVMENEGEYYSAFDNAHFEEGTHK